MCVFAGVDVMKIVIEETFIEGEERALECGGVRESERWMFPSTALLFPHVNGVTRSCCLSIVGALIVFFPPDG